MICWKSIADKEVALRIRLLDELLPESIGIGDDSRIFSYLPAPGILKVFSPIDDQVRWTFGFISVRPTLELFGWCPAERAAKFAKS
jgi:hypothetical protein